MKEHILFHNEEKSFQAVSYTHLRAHETDSYLVCRLLLEKIDMLDYADIVAINKMERKGGQDAMRDVAKQVQRNRAAFDKRPEEMPVYGTIAARFNDDV